MALDPLPKEIVDALEAMQQADLLNRRSALIAKGKPNELNNTDLQELVHIHNLLRRRSSGPPKETKKRTGSSMLPDKERLKGLL